MLSKPYIDAVLIGVDSLDQIQKNILWAQSPVGEKIVDQIDNIKVTDTRLLNPANWNK